MGTLIADLRDPIRFLLGDNESDIPEYADSVLDRGVKSVVQFGQLGSAYALSPDKTEITPALADANAWMLVAVKVARWFVANRPSSQSSRTRAFSESIGNYQALLFELEKHVYELENGDMFAGWGDLSNFIKGYSGMGDADTWGRWIRLRADLPMRAASLTSGGVQPD